MSRLATHGFHPFPPVRLSSSGFHRAPEPIGLFAGVDDVGAIRHPVHHRLAQSGIGKHLRPFGESKLVVINQRRPLCPLGNHLIEKLGTDIRQRDIAHFIDCDQFVTKPAGQKATHPIVLPGFDELVHQSRCRCETDTPPLPAGGNTQRGCQMGLTRAAITGQHDGFRTIDVAPFGEFTDLGRRDRGRLGKLEILQGLDLWQMSFTDAPFHGPAFPIFQFGGQQRFQILRMALLAFDCFGRQPRKLRTDGGQMQCLAVLPNRWPLLILALCSAHGITS